VVVPGLESAPRDDVDTDAEKLLKILEPNTATRRALRLRATTRISALRRRNPSKVSTSSVTP
jgi:hypothetical protein